MQGVVTPEAPLNGTSYNARVSVVDRVVDAASGTLGVRLELPNPGYRLPAGLKCKVRFR
jgi:multidrug efflux pump subunit AcrA (membrane-fusion protein)